MFEKEFQENFKLGQFLENEGIDFDSQRTQYVIKVCPECGGEDKLFIDKVSKLWVCHKCVEGDYHGRKKAGKGNLWYLLLHLGFSKRRVINIFKQEETVHLGNFELGEALTAPEPKPTMLPEYHIPNWLVKLDRSTLQIGTFYEAYKYLWDRFIRTPKQYEDFNIHYNVLQKRVVFPAYDEHGRCVGAQSRDIAKRYKDKHPKCPNKDCAGKNKYYFIREEPAPDKCPYCGAELVLTKYLKSLNTAGFPKSEIFYNIQNVDWTKPVVLVEGPFDAANVRNSLAFLGKTLSTTQLCILQANLKSSLILYLDGDKAGEDAVVSVLKDAQCFFDVRIVYAENNEDPGAFSVEENQAKVDSAISPTEWGVKKNLILF